jgi:SAM-dependent methyltransferase
MAETTSGIRAILSHPAVYDLWSRAVGSKRAQTILVRDHFRPWTGARVLDLGCGTGELLDYLGDVLYTGIDVSDEYISHAREHFGDRAEFLVGDATSVKLDPNTFDLVLAVGVLHHLDDAGARDLCEIAAAALRPSGRMITVDPAFTQSQNRAARFTIARDRGRNVRTPDAYPRLAAGSFETVSPIVREDLLHIPYTHCVLECERPLTG